MEHFSSNYSNQNCDKGVSIPKQKTSKETSNTTGPLINLLHNKNPPVSMQIKTNNNHGLSSIPVSSNISFNSGYVLKLYVHISNIFNYMKIICLL